MSIRIKPRKDIHEIIKDTQIEKDTYVPNIAICGESPCDDFVEERLSCEDCLVDTRLECLYNLRQRIKEFLIKAGCIAALFEEEETSAYASMDEKLTLRKKDVDLVLIIPTSMGPISELSAFAEDKIIRPKIRVLVPFEFHPFYGTSESYVTSVYKELMSDYGHVYPFDVHEEVHPDPLTIVSTLVSVYKRRKLLDLTGNMDNKS